MKNGLVHFRRTIVYHNPELVIRFIVLSLLLLAGLSPVWAQWRTSKYSNEFLSIGVGAAGLGLSGTQTAAVSDVTSAYWNPAGLTQLSRKNEIGLMHASYFGGIANYDYAGFATRIDSQSTLALSYIRFGVDDIPDTRYLIDNGQIDYRRITTFSSADNAAFFTYARRNAWIRGLSVGGSLKIIYRNAGKFANAWGFGIDAGAQYYFKKWKFGLMARDVTTTYNAWTYNTTELESVFAQTGNAIPSSSVEITLPTWILGVAHTFEAIPGKLKVTPASDWVTTFDGKRNSLISGKVSVDPRAGLEIKAFDLVAIRSGVYGWQKIKGFENKTNWSYQINFGVGLRWKAIALDYAITDLGNQAEALYSHIFSFKASF